VALLGNCPPAALPVVELSFDDRRPRLMTWDDKYHRRADEPTKLCPAPLPPPLLQRVADVARATFDCCHARDYARVDIRIDRRGQPWVLELNSMASLGPRGSYVRAAEVAGFSLDSLVNRIVEIARARYGGIPTATPDPARARAHAPTRFASLAAQRTA
jgi:D-alanine-D-alanine ligase